MSKFKKAKVVMLPTNEKATIGDLGLSINVLNFAKNNDWINIYNPIKQHLYIISDDEIKEGDWCINTGGNIKDSFPFRVTKEVMGNKFIKKIIASTDESLNNLPEKPNFSSYMSFSLGNPLPQPSKQFIQKFIEEYNRGNVITDVLVEYQTDFKSETKLYMLSMGDNPNDFKYGEPTIKINPKDNTITIKIVKDCYTREEVENLIYSAMKDRCYTTIAEWKKWIEENL